MARTLDRICVPAAHDIDPQRMGFPADWDQRPIWPENTP